MSETIISIDDVSLFLPGDSSQKHILHNICWQVLARQVIDSDDDVMDQFLRQHQREPFAAKCLAERLAKGGVAFSQLG